MHLQAGINDDIKTTLQKILIRLCCIILDQRFAAKGANDVYVGYAAATAVFLRNWPLFEKAWKKTLKISSWDNNTWRILGELIDPRNPPTEVDG